MGRYTQVFFVSDCQDGALEFGIAHPQEDAWDHKTARRVLLRRGDSFYVPPGNIYRLENHSSAKSAVLYWMIIKPLELEVPGSDGSGHPLHGEEEDQDNSGSYEDSGSNASPNTANAVVAAAVGRRYVVDDDDM